MIVIRVHAMPVYMHQSNGKHVTEKAELYGVGADGKRADDSTTCERSMWCAEINGAAMKRVGKAHPRRANGGGKPEYEIGCIDLSKYM
jgi:hypothetical protein